MAITKGQLKLILSFFLLISFEIVYAQVGVGNANPDPSAKLDVTSNTQGFLLPRMTFAERNAIVKPAAGLLLYCNNCGISGEWQGYNGKAWTNISGDVSSPVLTVGTNFQGGVIAYLFQSGDAGYVANQVHGIIAATVDQGSLFWGNLAASTGATDVLVGKGFLNTSEIITVQGNADPNYAAHAAKNYSDGNYFDWYLPSKSELNKLYLNKALIGNFNNNAFYWSSTETDQNNALAIDFSNGNQNNAVKNSIFSIRAIRSF